MGVINITSLNTSRQRQRSRTLSVHEPIPDSGQVLNSTGGYTWEVNDWDKLQRFLILGVEGGTYYVKEPELLKSNCSAVERCIKSDGLRVIREIVDVSTKGRAYRNDPAIFALALCTAVGDEVTKSHAYSAIPDVCRIGTHLYHFAKYCDGLRGWGRGLKTGIANWFKDMPSERLAYQMVKYQQRDGWSAKDVLRKVHPESASAAHNAVFRWVASGLEGLNARSVERIRNGKGTTTHYADLRRHLPKFIDIFEQAKTADEKTLVRLITEHNLPREAVPTEKLNSLSVWDALLAHMPLTAMIRNLGKMTNIGLIKPMSAAAKLVKDRLSDAVYLKKSRIHPLAVLMAFKVYSRGAGLKGSLTWTPVPTVLSVLNEAFYATFGNVTPAGKPMLIALDVSGSMSQEIAGSVISSSEAVAAMSLVWAATEPEVHIFGFAHEFRELNIRKGMDLEAAVRKAQDNNFGSTNVSLAYEYAIQHKLKVGGFVVMTDNETNCGPHAAMRLKVYRERFVHDARSVVAATASNPFTVNDPNDKWSLDVVGFDTSVPNVVTSFIRGTPAEVIADDEAE